MYTIIERVLLALFKMKWENKNKIVTGSHVGPLDDNHTVTAGQYLYWDELDTFKFSRMTFQPEC